jgi:UDP-N-acetylmuramoyl-tripeptide--D-alanyl-D-alanine ligase
MKDRLIIFLERYLLRLASTVLRRYRPLTIGITGSAGKTTTKEGLVYILRKMGLPLVSTKGNLNADLGIALSILGFDHSPSVYEWPFVFIGAHFAWLLRMIGIIRLPQYAVFEMGIDRIGDMARMLDSIELTVGIVTWIGDGHHLEYFKTPEKIADEKGLILSKLPMGGLAIISESDTQANRLELMASAPVVKIKATGKDALPEIILAVTDYLQLDRKRVEKLLQDIPETKGRYIHLQGIKQINLIDDTYNSSLPSIRTSLASLKKEPGKRKVAILADLLEQGEKEQENHEISADLARKNADLFISVGKRMKKVKSDYWYASPEEAAAAIPDLLKEGDAVLVKGSQGMRMEKVSYALAADKNEAKDKLPRQNVRWQQLPFRNP